jgi:peptidoglycan-N-acetylglucosamine deacetylase
MGTGKATRRAVLIVGGVALLTGYWQDPSTQVGDAAQTSARPSPPPAAPTRAAPAHTAPAHSAPAPHSAPARARLARARRPPARPGNAELPMTHLPDGRTGIALTIDDGPNPVYTPQVLRLLDRYRVTATFSMIGLQADAHPGLAREVAAAGHELANHTWSHLDLAYLPPAVVADQISRATGAIHRATGKTPTLFRAPFGAWSPAVLRLCAQSGMTPLDWSVDPRDWSRPGVATIVGNIMRNTRTGSIILEHDGGGNRAQTVAALKIVLPRLLDAGYHFTTP